MKKLKILYLLVMVVIIASCAKDQLSNSPDQLSKNVNSANVLSPKIKIAVVSDIHYLDPSLMPDDYVNDRDFQSAMLYDRKLIELSDPILRQTISGLLAERPDILLIPGDLSFEGEMISHEAVGGFLQQLENVGIKVFVIPGNNDINNPEAWDFHESVQAQNISPDLFAEIYGNFGYNEALYRDANSLSYVCQPVRGLWVLGIDANEIATSGAYAIKAATMNWILDRMADASENNITVLAMMHYGIIAHYSGQNSFEKLIENYKVRVSELMDAGLRVIFTGHYHANDIVDLTTGEKTLTEIETGSLVTPPSPYRIMTLGGNILKIDTKRITNVDLALPGGMDFLTYSDVNIISRLNSLFTYVLGHPPFSYLPDDAINLAPYVTNAFKAYFAGDENISPEEKTDIDALTDPLLKQVLNNIWTDLPPNDNEIKIRFK